jgi:hypothetical protein
MPKRCRWQQKIAFERSLWCAVLVCALLIGSVFGAPSASATPVKDVAGAAKGAVDSVGSTVTPDPGTPPPPSLPDVAPPARPQAPAVTRPLPPKPVKPPTEATPSPQRSTNGPSADTPPAGGIAGTARNLADAVSDADRKGAKGAASSRTAGDSASARQGAGAASEPKATAGTTGSVLGAPLAVTPSEIAAAEQWLARIWPGIPLGGSTGETGPLGGAVSALLRPAVLAATQLLSLVPSILQRASDFPSTIPPATANTPEMTLSDALAPTDWMKVVYLVTLIVLLAVLAFTIWKEMGPVLRANLR